MKYTKKAACCAAFLVSMSELRVDRAWLAIKLKQANKMEPGRDAAPIPLLCYTFKAHNKVKNSLWGF
ncbi:MAG: hypothetical protein HUU32_02540 [Calditrichaceae bacterium]|nr:hypothetical protein [Calditrichia bacterium]NUQ40256.1 hypothetical protein [Calditrichaceae bacterium]